VDLAEDLALGGWAGEIPLRLAASAPVADEHVPAGTPLPEGVRSAVHRRR
jgi:hypothetical protein